MNLRTLRRRIYHKNWPTGPVRARIEAALAHPPIHELADRDAPPIIAKPLVTRPARSVKHLSEASAKI